MSKYTAHWPKNDPRRRTDAKLNKKISLYLSSVAMRKYNKDFPLPEDPYKHLRDDYKNI